MSYITQRLAALRTQIQQILASGEVAPPSTWISPMTARNRPGGRLYHYFKLMQATNSKSRSGKVQGKCIEYLGKADNPKYKKWKAAIERRNRIQQLEQLQEKLERMVSVGRQSQPSQPSSTAQPKATQGSLKRYRTSLVRVPTPIKALVLAIIEQFYEDAGATVEGTILDKAEQWWVRVTDMDINLIKTIVNKWVDTVIYCE